MPPPQRKSNFRDCKRQVVKYAAKKWGQNGGSSATSTSGAGGVVPKQQPRIQWILVTGSVIESL